MRGDTHQHRHIRELMPFVLQRLDFLADQPCLFFRIPSAGDGDFLARLVFGEQGLAQPSVIMGDQMRGGGENMSC